MFQLLGMLTFLFILFELCTFYNNKKKNLKTIICLVHSVKAWPSLRSRPQTVAHPQGPCAGHGQRGQFWPGPRPQAMLPCSGVRRMCVPRTVSEGSCTQWVVIFGPASDSA